MKKILCFGDSNTFGYNPSSGKRYDKNTRWTGLLQNLAGNKFKIVEAGCNNRTGFCDNPAGLIMTGYKILPQLLEKDLFCVILAIGINDLQIFYNMSLEDIKSGIENLIDIIHKELPLAKILLLSPSVLTDDIEKGSFSIMFDKTSVMKSHQIGTIYESVSKNKGCEFIDLNKIAKVSQIDGLHYDADEHEKIAHAVFKTLSNL